MIDPLRSCPATNTESDRDCDPDSDADTDSGSTTAVFMRRRVRSVEAGAVRAGGADASRGCWLPVFMLMGAHPAHELLSLFHLTVAPEETYSAEQNQPGALEGSI